MKTDRIAQHAAARKNPRGFEVPIVSLLNGWLAYADAHRERYESVIGEDYVLGPEWLEIGKALHGLLNGETGRLDCGTLSELIHGVLRDNGFDKGIDA